MLMLLFAILTHHILLDRLDLKSMLSFRLIVVLIVFVQVLVVLLLLVLCIRLS